MKAENENSLESGGILTEALPAHHQSTLIDPCQPAYEEIAVCAYFIWWSEGCPSGKDLDHWTQAEQQMRLSCWHQKVHLLSSPEILA